MKAESEVIDLTMDAENGATPPGETDDEATEASAELPPRSRVSLPERPDSRPETPGERGHSPDQVGSDDGKILIVGQEIVFNGKISSLDRLIVEGKVEAKIKDCRAIEIAETGHFKGQVEFERADIAGVFEGDLMVREHRRPSTLRRRRGSQRKRRGGGSEEAPSHQGQAHAGQVILKKARSPKLRG